MGVNINIDPIATVIIELVKHYGIAEFGGDGGSDGLDWAFYVGTEPDKPDNCATLFERMKRAVPIQNQVELFMLDETVEIRVRGRDYNDTFQKAVAFAMMIYKGLTYWENKDDLPSDFDWGGRVPGSVGCKALTGPMYLYRSPKGLHTWSFEVIVLSQTEEEEESCASDSCSVD